MGELKLDRVAARRRRHLRIRQKVLGTPERPRLCVYRSLKHIYAQIIDDTSGRVLVSTSSVSPEAKSAGASSKNIASARIVGEMLAEKAKGSGIEKVVFDRNGYLYHGRVKALAEGAREKGVKF
ncbi:MAG: 50S ribosomal protein L18 [Candidatus Hydrogenedentota bacterium]|nr:MAG: 50S ribosomal protein L18 [Candidatus Hydrogenedentota bacterium]